MSDLVQDWMTPYEKLCTLNPDDTVRRAQEEMRKRNIHSVLVRQKHGIRGYLIFTYTDLMRVISDGRSIHHTKLADVAVPADFTTYPDSTMIECIDNMLKNNVNHLLVTEPSDGDKVVGIISSTDAERYAFEKLNK